jgi:hypothetical protein
MYTQFNSGYLRAKPQSLANVSYALCSAIFSQKIVADDECQSHLIEWQVSQRKWWRNVVIIFFGPLGMW